MMPIDVPALLKDIDSVLAERPEAEGGLAAVRELNALYTACLYRVALPGTPQFEYVRGLQPIPAGAKVYETTDRERNLKAQLIALRKDLAAGRFEAAADLLHASFLGDLLEQSSALAQSGYLRAAIILAGCALEDHLRKLADKFQVPVLLPDEKWKKANMVNADLVKAGAYTKADQAHVEACLKDRNDASHPPEPKKAPPKLTEAVHKRVADFVRDFVGRFPA